MKVLIINDKRSGGGAEVQSQREYSMIRSHGHEAFFLTFDCDFPTELDGHTPNIPVNRNDLQKAWYRVVRCPEEEVIKRVIDEISPDVIHLENVYDTSASLFKIVARYPTLQTVRDYTVICPKSTCITNEDMPCSGYKLGKCLSCCKSNAGHIVRTLIQSIYNRNRMQAVDMLVAPSGALARAATANGIPIDELNNPFDFSKSVTNARRISQKRRYFAYGRICRVKGFGFLLDAWSIFSKNRNDVELVIAGRIDKDYEKSFLKKCRMCSNVQYLGPIAYDEVMQLYPSVYCVVVPSIWMENYPNTVLEALANKVLVTGSRRGGIPDMVGDDRFLFEPTQTDSILSTLKYVDSITESEREDVVCANYARVIEENSPERYYERLMRLFSTLIDNGGATV